MGILEKAKNRRFFALAENRSFGDVSCLTARPISTREPQLVTDDFRVRCGFLASPDAAPHEKSSRESTRDPHNQPSAIQMARLANRSADRSKRRTGDLVGRVLGYALASLILVFVIGMLANAEAAVARRNDGMAFGRFQDSTESSNAQASSIVLVTYPTNTIQLGVAALNVGPFVGCKNVARVEVIAGFAARDCQVKSALKDAAWTKVQAVPNSRIGWQQVLIPHDVASDAELRKSSIGRSCVYADQLYGDRNLLRNVARDPEMFNTNFWPMARTKFVSLSINRISGGNSGVFSWRQAIPYQPQLAQENTDLNRAHQHQSQSENTRGIVRHPVPDGVPFVLGIIFLCALGAGYFLAWLMSR